MNTKKTLWTKLSDKKLLLFAVMTIWFGFMQADTLTGPINQPQDSADLAINMARQIHKNMASINDTLNQMRQNYTEAQVEYIEDRDAIDEFKKNKDSIYRASAFWFTKYKKNSPENTRPPGWKPWYKRFTFWVSFLILAGVWYFGIRLFNNSGMCRSNNGLPLNEQPYSYSRVQFFWWTMIILSVYIFFFAFTGLLIPVNSTAVILLGAGILVYSGGKIIDQRQSANLGGKAIPQFKTEGWYVDVISDETGINMHRFQSFIFNILFGVGYVVMFMNNVKACDFPFPDFSEWQLALLGISSAAYLGMKTTELSGSNINTATNTATNTGNNTLNQESNTGGTGNQGTSN